MACSAVDFTFVVNRSWVITARVNLRRVFISNPSQSIHNEKFHILPKWNTKHWIKKGICNFHYSVLNTYQIQEQAKWYIKNVLNTIRANHFILPTDYIYRFYMIFCGENDYFQKQH